MIAEALKTHRGAVLGAAIALALLAAVPLFAYGIVPLFVKSTLVEDLPTAAPSVQIATPATSAGSSGEASSPAASPTPGLVTLATGQLVRVSAADYGTGAVRIVKLGPDRFLRFEDVDIAGAPDMYVYLSNGTDGKPGVFADLGKLKATNGSFNYAIPADLDLTSVRSVVVWCRQFTVTVTYALLK